MAEVEKPIADSETSTLSQMFTVTEFLEGFPPAQPAQVKDICAKKFSGSGSYYEIKTPKLQLHCTSEMCNGPRSFRYESGDRILRSEDIVKSTYLTYLCSNCRTTRETYSICVVHKASNVGECFKYGVWPQYGPPTPARLIRLFGKDREIFLKGRQCENHGLGIGAFTYYRRVVESHKNQILDEIIRVATKIGAPAEMLKALNEAKAEIQFSKALSSVKDAMPQALLINGHNPLTVLHKALSVGVHELDDEQCLQIAHDVRVLLVELAERLGQALKDEAGISTAINRLMKSGK